MLVALFKALHAVLFILKTLAYPAADPKSKCPPFADLYVSVPPAYIIVDESSRFVIGTVVGITAPSLYVKSAASKSKNKDDVVYGLASSVKLSNLTAPEPAVNL